MLLLLENLKFVRSWGKIFNHQLNNLILRKVIIEKFTSFLKVPLSGLSGRRSVGHNDVIDSSGTKYLKNSTSKSVIYWKTLCKHFYPDWIDGFISGYYVSVHHPSRIVFDLNENFLMKIEEYLNITFFYHKHLGKEERCGVVAHERHQTNESQRVTAFEMEHF